jgi:hypothetical protein
VTETTIIVAMMGAARTIRNVIDVMIMTITMMVMEMAAGVHLRVLVTVTVLHHVPTTRTTTHRVKASHQDHHKVKHHELCSIRHRRRKFHQTMSQVLTLLREDQLLAGTQTNIRLAIPTPKMKTGSHQSATQSAARHQMNLLRR